MIKRQLELIKALCDRLYCDGQHYADGGLINAAKKLFNGDWATSDEEMLHTILLLKQELDRLERMVRGE